MTLDHFWNTLDIAVNKLVKPSGIYFVPNSFFTHNILMEQLFFQISFAKYISSVVFEFSHFPASVLGVEDLCSVFQDLILIGGVP